jgi:hypothetical protein
MSDSQKLSIHCLSVFFAAAALVPACYAQDPARRTVIDVPYAVQVDSTILQPGRYVIRVMNPSDQNVVNILTADEKTVVATIVGVPVFRSEEAMDKAGRKTEFWFSSPASVRPRQVKAWFYPGSEQGVELLSSTPKQARKNSER